MLSPPGQVAENLVEERVAWVRCMEREGMWGEEKELLSPDSSQSRGKKGGALAGPRQELQPAFLGDPNLANHEINTLSLATLSWHVELIGQIKSRARAAQERAGPAHSEYSDPQMAVCGTSASFCTYCPGVLRRH